MLLAWIVIVALILLTGLYVAAEFAAVSARRSRLRRMAEDGNVLAARMLPVLEDPKELDRYIAASQVGITLSSLILGAYGQATLAPRLAPLLERFGPMQPATAESTAAVVVLLFLTTLAVIVGELVPKSLALQNPTATALFTVLPMQWSIRVFSWSIAFLNGSGVLLLQADARADHRTSPRALAGGDRAAHRGEPRRRAARAAGAGPAAPRAASRPAHREAADGAARPARRRRRGRRRSTTCSASSRRARTAGCPSIAARSTTSSAFFTSRTSSRSSSQSGDSDDRVAAAADRPGPRLDAAPIDCSRSCASAAAIRPSSWTRPARSSA